MNKQMYQKNQRHNTSFTTKRELAGNITLKSILLFRNTHFVKS